jgi:ubiquitin carboxyl-terminal hydrolase 7
MRAEATHTFTAQETDWGFTETLLLEEVYGPGAGWVVNDTLVVRVNVRVVKDEGFDMRARTGFVGLKNQGATCYMNSLLQYLYNLPYFRKVGQAGRCVCVCV